MITFFKKLNNLFPNNIFSQVIEQEPLLLDYQSEKLPLAKGVVLPKKESILREEFATHLNEKLKKLEQKFQVFFFMLYRHGGVLSGSCLYKNFEDRNFSGFNGPSWVKGEKNLYLLCEQNDIDLFFSSVMDAEAFMVEYKSSGLYAGERDYISSFQEQEKEEIGYKGRIHKIIVKTADLEKDCVRVNTGKLSVEKYSKALPVEVSVVEKVYSIEEMVFSGQFPKVENAFEKFCEKKRYSIVGYKMYPTDRVDFETGKPVFEERQSCHFDTGYSIKNLEELQGIIEEFKEKRASDFERFEIS